MDENGETTQLDDEKRNDVKSSRHFSGVILSIFAILGLIGLMFVTQDWSYSFHDFPKGDWSAYFQFEDALHEYIRKHNGQLPDLERWCDALLEDEEVAEKLTGVLDAEHKDACPYILNKNLAGIQEVPYDMVLFYIIVGQTAWNRVGDKGDLVGNETVWIGTHYRGVDNVSVEMVPYLKWRVNDNPGQGWKVYDIAMIGYLIVLSLIGCLVAYACRTSLKMYRTSAIIISLFCGFLWYMAGGITEHRIYNYHIFVDRIYSIPFGWIYGAVTGILIVGLVGRWQVKKEKPVLFLFSSLAIGGISGVVCAVATHLFLMLAYNTEELGFLIRDIAPGIRVGFFLGLLTYVIMGMLVKKYPNNTTSN